MTLADAAAIVDEVSPDHDISWLPPEIEHREWILAGGAEPEAPQLTDEADRPAIDLLVEPKDSAPADPAPEASTLEDSAPSSAVEVSAREESLPDRTAVIPVPAFAVVGLMPRLALTAALLVVVVVAVGLSGLAPSSAPAVEPPRVPVAVDEPRATSIPKTETQLNTLPLPPEAKPSTPPGTSAPTTPSPPTGEAPTADAAPVPQAPAAEPVAPAPQPSTPPPTPTTPDPSPTPTDPAPEPSGVPILCDIVAC